MQFLSGQLMQFLSGVDSLIAGSVIDANNLPGAIVAAALIGVDLGPNLSLSQKSSLPQPSQSDNEG